MIAFPENGTAPLGGDAETDNNNETFFNSDVPVYDLPGSTRDVVGFLAFFRHIEEQARSRSFYTPSQQATITFLAFASLADAHFLEGASIRQIAAELSDLKFTHELFNREVARVQAKFPGLHRAHGRVSR